MFIIPGFLISLITFPGVIVHELGHLIFCKLMKVPIYDVKYFQMQNPCGYVAHEPTDSPWKTFIISIGPFIVNTIIGIIIMFPISLELFVFKNYYNPIYFILGWIGISILMHAFPSSGDAKVLYANVIKNSEISFLVKIFVLPVVGLIYLGSIGSVIWLDLFYAVNISILIPKFLCMFI